MCLFYLFTKKAVKARKVVKKNKCDVLLTRDGAWLLVPASFRARPTALPGADTWAEIGGEWIHKLLVIVIAVLFCVHDIMAVTPVWFMVVDHNITCVLRHANCVDVPFDGFVDHFLKRIKALGWEILSDASGDLNVWKLRTPLPSQDVDQECLAKLKDQENLERGEGEYEGGEEKKKRKLKPKGKGKEKAKSEEEKQEGAFALLLKPDDKISSHFEPEELTVHDARIQVLVQIPAKAGGTSYRAVSTRCWLIQLRM